MKLYTTYFANLKNLPDTIIPVSISLWTPKGINIINYSHLAPTKEIIQEYKKSNFSNKEKQKCYIQKYYQDVLDKLSPEIVLKDLIQLSRGRDIALVCFEKPANFCHRHLVIKWLSPYFCKMGIQNGFEYKK